MTPTREMIVKAARSICQARGFDPDLMVMRGTPMNVAGQWWTITSEPAPAWRAFEADALAAFRALPEPQ